MKDWISLLKGEKHFVYRHLDDDAVPRMMITRAGTTDIEMGWIAVTLGITKIPLSYYAEGGIDRYAERLLERRKYEANMVA